MVTAHASGRPAATSAGPGSVADPASAMAVPSGAADTGAAIVAVGGTLATATVVEAVPCPPSLSVAVRVTT